MTLALVHMVCDCGHPMSAVTSDALLEARQAHIAFHQYVRAIGALLAPPVEPPR